MSKVAVIILNRNLPQVTDQLFEKLISSGSVSPKDVYVVEAGSQERNLSKHCTWWANWDESIEHGLRVPRGFNFALANLYKEDRYRQYDYFFLITNDTEIHSADIVATLKAEIEVHPKVGILSPCSKRWGEASLLKPEETRYFWYVEHLAWLVRREFIDDIRAVDDPSFMNFFYDGTNFRGYESNIEIIAKAYANDWATAITNRAWISENENHLKTKADLIKTEPHEENLQKCFDEGKKWLRSKYGFNSRWSMQTYVKLFYEQFFKNFPDLIRFSI